MDYLSKYPEDEEDYKKWLSGDFKSDSMFYHNHPVCCGKNMGSVVNDNEDWFECSKCGKTIA